MAPSSGKIKSLFGLRKSKGEKSGGAASAPPPTEQSSADRAASSAPPPVATVASPPSKLETSAVASDQRPIQKGDNYGLTPLHIPGSVSKVGVDLVFVHGLGGNAFRTWYNEEGDVYWPWELLKEDAPNIRTYAFGYDANVASFWGGVSQNRLSMHASNLLGQLYGARAETDTVGFITSSRKDSTNSRETGATQHYFRCPQFGWSRGGTSTPDIGDKCRRPSQTD
jgi:hypothetical protein